MQEILSPLVPTESNLWGAKGFKLHIRAALSLFI